MTVSVTTQRTPSASICCAIRVRAVDDEHVDEPLVAGGDAAWLRAACQALEHPVGGTLQGAATDDRADCDTRHAPPLERGPDVRDGEDRPDRDERIAGGDHDHIGGLDRVEHTGRGHCRRLPVEAHPVDVVAVLTRDEPLLEGERAGRRIDPRPERIVGGGQQRHRDAKSLCQPACHRREQLTGAQRLRTDEVETEVAVAELEPRLAA